MQNSNRKSTLISDSLGEICALNENNLSVHNISMNAVLSSTLNLDNIYKYFSNCIYKPRDFKCIRIDVPVSKETIDKYINYVRKKQERAEKRRGKRRASEKDVPIEPSNEISRDEVSSAKKETDANGETDGMKYKMRRVETQASVNHLKPLESRIDVTQNKNKTRNDEHLLGMQRVGGVKMATDDDDVLELLNEINSVDTGFAENEKIIINVSLFANGKLICTGNNSVEACKIAMKKIENKLKEYNVKNIKLRRVTITNILAVYNAGFSIVLPLLAQYYKNVDYDPNVFPACKVKIALENSSGKSAKVVKHQEEVNELAWATTSKENNSYNDTYDIISASIFSTGNITLTGAKNYENLKRTIRILLPYLFKCRSMHHSGTTE